MIRVVYPGSRIRMLTFSHPGSRIQGSKRHPIPDPGSGSATLAVTYLIINNQRHHGGKELYQQRQLQLRLPEQCCRFLSGFFGQIHQSLLEQSAGVILLYFRCNCTLHKLTQLINSKSKKTEFVKFKKKKFGPFFRHRRFFGPVLCFEAEISARWAKLSLKS
jgi:hypothetical protein